MKKIVLAILLAAPVLLFLSGGAGSRSMCATDDQAPLSEESEECIECHEAYTPGIVADWRSSRHAGRTPSEAIAEPELERRFSAGSVPESFAGVAVGCYECHSLNADAHPDSFEHEGYRINLVPSPNDCKVCHPEEVEQYGGSKKAHAVGNLIENQVYAELVAVIDSPRVYNLGDQHVAMAIGGDATKEVSCLACHGTEVTVLGLKEIESDYGRLTVPNLKGWPNQGVGRINPDGSMGCCTACHPRHSFSIEIARKPYTCLQCHLNPDVPGWEVWRESKHGNIALSLMSRWDWEAVPWSPGRHFTAPSCSACHNSLLVDGEGEVLAERTHDFGARLYKRLFGLIYSHSQPLQGDTNLISNADGLPLPTTLDGREASQFLIDEQEQGRRRAGLIRICRACHGSSWAAAHFDRLDKAVADVDLMVLTATNLMRFRAWEVGLADPQFIFDEPLEMQWVRQWLFYANSVRYAAAMGGPDYTAFKNGWWYLSENLTKLAETIEQKEAAASPGQAGDQEER